MTVKIFDKRKIDDVYTEKRQAIAKAVKDMDPKFVMSKKSDELADLVIQRHKVTPVKIRADEIRHSRKEVIIGETERQPRLGWDITWTLPFDGSSEVIDFIAPPQLSLKCSLPLSAVNVITLSYETVDWTLNEARELFTHDHHRIGLILDRFAGQIAQENAALRNYAISIIDAKRALHSDIDAQKILGYPGDLKSDT